METQLVSNLRGDRQTTSFKYVKFFDELGIDDVPLVGGKNANLGEMYRELSSQNLRVPNGYAITVDAYKSILTKGGVWGKLQELLKDLDPNDVTSLQRKGQQARELIYNCPIPVDIRNEITEAYQQLKEEYGEDVSLAVRSSATAEDSPNASFAGQNDTYLNVSGDDALLDAYKRCLASLFTDRSIHYKMDNGIDQFKVYLSVVVMKMVRSDIGSSGVMFSIDTETGFRDVVFINATIGLGENVVQGTIDPDSFYVYKPTFEKGYRTVLKRRLGSKEMKMVFAKDINTQNIALEFTKNIPTTEIERSHYAVTDDDVMVLADYAIKIEKHYSKKAGHDKPMDMEWAKDGKDGYIYIVQARPETVQSQKKGKTLEVYHLKESSKVLVIGRAVGTKIGAGRIRVIKDSSHLKEFLPGEILVSDTTTPDWEPVMKTAAAVVTNKGGRTCHAAIISRELGIPAVVGCGNATEVLGSGQEVTVSCAEGEDGKIYERKLQYEITKTDLSKLAKPRTRIMVNLGNPDMAFSLCSLPVDGVGLARMEFIISEYIKIHPMVLINPEKLDEVTKKEIDNITFGYPDKRDFFIQKLSEGVGTIAAAFYPRPVIVRMSDFKTNEYASLVGGKFFELDEDNPMIGFRGASRYSHPLYEAGFGLECAAIKRVRETMGLSNLIVMIPFCRRVSEGKQVLKTMEKFGLKRGDRGLEVYVMCEIPNNVIQVDQFAEIFDGFSIGSNDLTQLTLGVDRDSEIVAFDFDERDNGVLQMIKMAVEGCKRNNRHSGICGEAPSDYPEIAEYLVNLGIDSISLNPDSVLKTIGNVLTVENRQAKSTSQKSEIILSGQP
jgi:pyruvate, water dikinase